MSIAPKASYVEWCPGNGTRYALHFSLLPHGRFGRGEPTIMIVGPTYRANRALILCTELIRWVTLSNVMEVMGLNEADAVPVTIMIAAVLGIEAIIPDGATTEGTPWRALPPFTFQEEPVL